MVPPMLPEPGLLVTITGVLELAGAAGLLWHRTAPWAAGGLAAMLLVMFPVNVYAALEGLSLGGSPATPLFPRTLMQLLFLAAALSVVAYHPRRRRPALSAAHDTDNAHEATAWPAATAHR